MNPELTFHYTHSSSMGYGRAGVKIAEALERAGVDVYDLDDGLVPETPESSKATLEQFGVDFRDPSGTDMVAGTRHKHTRTICWLTTPGHPRGWWEGQHAAMFTMWETTRVPEAFRDTLHEFDTLIVPCRQNLELFSQYHPNVRLVPLGIDPEDWHYIERTSPEREFRFLIGGSGERKGTDLAFRAFQAVFGQFYDGPRWTGEGPPAVLVNKQPRLQDGFYAPWSQIIGGRISAQEERDLYAGAHCYLQPSRGEGFGLQPLQAIAQGLPTILTNAHGQADYAHLGIPISAKEVPAGYFAFGNPRDMNWWEPDFEELCEAMWDVYSHYETHRLYAQESAEHAKDWTWDHSAAALIDALGDSLTQEPPGRVTWRKPNVKLYLVRVNKRWSAWMGDRFHIFEPGKDYYQTADVKRILFESNLLASSCLERVAPDGTDIDNGLTDAQLERVDHHKAENAYCPTCEQRLNTQLTKADALYEEMLAGAP